MVTSRIVVAIEERERWLEREKELVEKMKGMSKDERKTHRPEIERIRNQIRYYDSLIREMKSNMKPEGNPIHEAI